MDNLNKTIKKLNDKDYESLLTAVAGNKKDKPYIVLEAARKEQLTDAEMVERLGVNSSTYYTLKSRLNTKIASVLSKDVKNPIGALMEKVARVPANLYGTNKTISIKALEDLEKELIEYDLNNELIPRWVQVTVLGTSADMAHRVTLEDRQPRWDNAALLSRMSAF